MSALEPDAPGRSGADQRYLIVFGACLTQFMVIGLLFAFGLFFKVFEEEFGWTRAMVSGCTSLAFLMMGVFAVAAGPLNDRYGPRIVLSVTGVLYGLGYALISQVSEIWHVYVIFGVFIALGMSTHDVVTLSTVARWFERRRGVMTGVVKVGTAAGQVALPPTAAILIAAYGWRDATMMLGALALVLLLLAAMSMRAPPKPAGGAGGASEHGVSYAEARRSRVFWTLCATQFLFFATLTTVPLHIAVHGTDLGMDAPTAAGLLSVIGGASVAGRLTIGALSDRLGGRNAYLLCLAPVIASVASLLAIEDPWLLFPALALYGFGHGGLFTIVSPTIAGYFGTKAHGAIFGTVVLFGTMAGAAGPIAAGWVFDVTGAYDWAFMTLAGACALAFCLVASLPAEPSRS